MAKSVCAKLGWKDGMAGWALQRPAELAEAIPFPTKAPAKEPEVIVAFVKSVAEVPQALESVRPRYVRGRARWCAYPKKTGAIRTDISRDQGWEAMGAFDLLPVTQVALDDTWSALRFRYRDEIKTLTRKFA